MIDTAEARRHAAEYRADLMRLTQTAPMVIEAMAGEIERLRAALKPFADMADDLDEWDRPRDSHVAMSFKVEDIRAARAACEQRSPETDKP